MNIELYEDELNVYLCVLDERSACLGIGRVSKEDRYAHEGLSDLFEQLKADPEAWSKWSEFGAPGLTYERKILSECLLCCWTDDDGTVCIYKDTSPVARAIIGGKFADFYDDIGEPDRRRFEEPDDCDECRFSGLLEED